MGEGDIFTTLAQGELGLLREKLTRKEANEHKSEEERALQLALIDGLREQAAEEEEVREEEAEQLREELRTQARLVEELRLELEDVHMEHDRKLDEHVTKEREAGGHVERTLKEELAAIQRKHDDIHEQHHSHKNEV